MPGQRQTLTDTLLTPVEVADELGIGRATVYQLFKVGQLKYVDVHTGFGTRIARRVRREDLEEFIRRRTEGEVT